MEHSERSWSFYLGAYTTSKTKQPHDIALMDGRLRLRRAADGRTLFPGTLLGRSEIISLVCRGGSGAVYRARDVRLRRDVALKILDWPPRLQWGWALNEVRIASSLIHPRICVNYDVGEENGMAYIAMEYLEGSSLSLLSIPSVLGPALAIGCSRLIASALALQRLRAAGFCDAEIAEILANVALCMFANYFNHVARTELDFPKVSIELRLQL